MAIHCPQCGISYDILQFSAEGGSASGGEGGIPFIICQCGQKVTPLLLETIGDFLRYFENKEEREKARSIQKDAERICQMILDEASHGVDIDIAKENLKEKVRKLFPDKMDTYRMIYEARFKRLWDQFRGPNA